MAHTQGRTGGLRTRLGLIGLGTLAGTMLLTAGIATSPATATPQGSTPFTGLASDSIEWSGCGEQLECAKVRVPLDWDKPDGRTIKLAVIRHLASRPEERASLLAWQASAAETRAVVANEAKQPDQFRQHYRRALDLVAEAMRLGPDSVGVFAIAGGSQISLADRLPPAERATAWELAYRR